MTWSKPPTPRGRHSVRLFLNAKAQSDVRMQVAILCEDLQVARPRALGTGLVPLQIRSNDLGATACGCGPSELPAAEKIRVEEATPLRRARQKKRRKVRFVDPSGPDDGNRIAVDPLEDTQSSNAPRDPRDLCLSGHFCPEIARQTPDASGCITETCYGHIEHLGCLSQGYRHWLYLDRYMAQTCSKKATVVEDVLGQPIHNRLTIVGQLRLALHLASAVLKFSSTPWLSDLWTMRDVSFFHRGGSWDSSLETLHFSTELAHQQPQQGALMDLEVPRSIGPIEDAQYEYGIRNVMLYSLGVALLAIGRWERVELGNVKEVRRLASQSCYLGPTYSELVEKVLDCDFGQGKDLKKPKLREAVYECIILELQGMVARYEQGDD